MIVTLSGAVGVGAPEIGQLVAARLGLDYVDREVLGAAAQTLSVTPEELERLEEPATKFKDKLGRLLGGFIERSGKAGSWDPIVGDAGLEFLLSRTYGEAASLPTTGHWLDEKTYIETLRSIVRDIGRRERVVIVGRASQMFLADFPASLHLLLVAPKDRRQQILVERDNLTPADASHRIADSDKGRHAFYKKYFKVDVDSPELYDLVLDTDRFGFETTADLISEAAQAARTPVA